jgi:5-methylcytosine-specific restriction endonuclease McrA
VKLFLARDLVDGTPRKAMSPQRRQRILDANGHVCGHDGCETAAGLEIDHITPLALNGEDVDANCIPLCRAHHKEKTRRDIWMIAKAKRQRGLVEEIEPSKNPIRSRNEWPKGQKLQSRGFEPSRRVGR